MNVDMTYRFTQDNEPTDEQLLVIMQEVGEEVRRGQEAMARQVVENIREECRRINSSQQTNTQV